MSMEFWGVEVKAGEPLKVIPEGEKIIHISQAALGEGKKDKGNNFVPLRLKIDGQKLVVGNLSAEHFPQLTFDLVFDREFELSHDWKNGSVYFCGYKVDGSSPENEGYSDSDFSSDEEEVKDHVITAIENVVKPETSKASASKPESSSKPKVMLVGPNKANEFEEDDDEEEDDSDDEEELSDSDEDEEMLDDTDEGSDDETTPKVGPGKKRVIDSMTKTPVIAKKTKLASPQKSGGKKGAHTATPYPSKQAGKAPVTSTKSKDQTPKSGGQVSCKSCSKTFNSESALQSHMKAKHSGNQSSF